MLLLLIHHNLSLLNKLSFVVIAYRHVHCCYAICTCSVAEVTSVVLNELLLLMWDTKLRLYNTLRLLQRNILIYRCWTKKVTSSDA